MLSICQEFPHLSFAVLPISTSYLLCNRLQGLLFPLLSSNSPMPSVGLLCTQSLFHICFQELSLLLAHSSWHSVDTITKHLQCQVLFHDHTANSEPLSNTPELYSNCLASHATTLFFVDSHLSSANTLHLICSTLEPIALSWQNFL